MVIMNARFVRADADRQREHTCPAPDLARNGAGTVAGNAAHPLPRGGQLERRIQGWKKGYYVGAGEGKLNGTGVKEPVSEGEDPFAINIGDGPVGADSHIA